MSDEYLAPLPLVYSMLASVVDDRYEYSLLRQVLNIQLYLLLQEQKVRIFGVSWSLCVRVPTWSFKKDKKNCMSLGNDGRHVADQALRLYRGIGI